MSESNSVNMEQAGGYSSTAMAFKPVGGEFTTSPAASDAKANDVKFENNSQLQQAAMWSGQTTQPTQPPPQQVQPQQAAQQAQPQPMHSQQQMLPGQAQAQPAQGQPQQLLPPPGTQRPMGEMIMHPLGTSEHHQYPPDGPPHEEPAAQDALSHNGAGSSSVAQTAESVQGQEQKRPPEPAEPPPIPTEQDGSCSLSFLTFLHDLEADGICELLHDEVPQRLKGVSGWSVREEKMEDWRRRRQAWFMKGKEGRTYKPTSFYQFLRRLGFFPTETTKRATHGLDFEGSKTFKWNGNRRHKYIQSKKEKETLSLEHTRRSIVHSDNSAIPVFGGQPMQAHSMMAGTWLPPASWTAHAQHAAQHAHQQHQQQQHHMQHLHAMSSPVLTWPQAQHYMQGGPAVWPSGM